MNSNDQLRKTVYAALFAALIAAGAFIAIPVGPVPIVLQNLFVLLAGLILGPRWGVYSVALYLLMGGFGFPVFAGGTGGIGRLFGPTGGYLIGYLPAVFVAGLVSHQLKKTRTGDAVAMVAGSVIVYVSGVPWLKFATGMAWDKAFMAGMVPFIPGDLIKIGAAIFAARIIRQVVK
ncbi:BioY family protein [Desulforapulum autotrophicum HRM2]|uniref:Biotin transporter n=1 Tax=Desulforapulum autotrophicum (strain ATCC 43914 / DSM 3382 / VKM B-1955 / HRM2) TaxID=177437 RepID=C0QI51_DESAH|nr:biotin transporter BioY [Desulforapulum autotrophicum]ACN15787.1 BioY family protein [Desulforapulum autotrophicum HRM2]